MRAGTTRFFYRKRGFGFIKGDDGRVEVFAHDRTLGQPSLQALLPALLAALLLFVMMLVHLTTRLIARKNQCRQRQRVQE
jgi:hypothetical protein